MKYSAPASLLALALTASMSFAALPFAVTDFNTETVRVYSGAGALQWTQSVDTPTGVVMDSEGRIYVASFNEGNIYRFTNGGTALGVFATKSSFNPSGLAFDSAGNLYVNDYTNGVVEKFNTSGGYVAPFASTGLSNPDLGIIFDAAGSLYVADSVDGDIEVYNSGGTHIDTWSFTAGTAGYGGEGLAFDGAGNLYVSDLSDSQIEKFNSVGTSLGSITSSALAPYGMAYDWTTGRLDVALALSFFSFPSEVRTFETNGTLGPALVNSGLDWPYGVALLPEPSSLALLAAGAAMLRRRPSRWR